MLKEMAINSIWLFLIILFTVLSISVIITPFLEYRKLREKADMYDNIMNDFENFVKNLPPDDITVHKVELPQKNNKND